MQVIKNYFLLIKIVNDIVININAKNCDFVNLIVLFINKISANSLFVYKNPNINNDMQNAKLKLEWTLKH